MSPREKVTDDSDLTPEAQAVRWFLRVQQGTLSEAERESFDTWRAGDVNAAAFSRASRIWNAIDEVATVPEIVRQRGQILERTRRRRIHRRALIAASVAAVTITIFSFSRRTEQALPELRTTQMPLRAPSKGAFATTVGQRSTLTLSDGSVLTLDTDSAATVAFNEHERKIALTRGQAMFEVATEARRPFVVYAGDQRVVATGTVFDIRLDRAAVEVTLLEGHVIVDQAGAAAGRDGHSSASLNAGQRLVAKAGSAVSVGAADVAQISGWTGGKLVFSGTRLADAVAESNRYTPAPISLAESSLSDMRINGVFRAGQPAEFARAVAQIYPITVDYLPDGQIRISAKTK